MESHSAHNFVSAVKSRLTDTLAADADYSKMWQTSFTSLDQNLVSMRLLPHYFAPSPPPPGAKINAWPVLYAMRKVTDAIGRKSANRWPHHVQNTALASKRIICDSEDPTTCRGCVGMSSLLFAFTEANASTMEPRQGPMSRELREYLPVTWKSLGVAASFYLNSVGRLWNSGLGIEPLLLFRMTRILKDDIIATVTFIDDLHGQLWFWKVFVGAHMLATTATFENHDQYRAQGLDLEASKSWYSSQLAIWSLSHQVTSWEQARAVLSAIVWPDAEHEREAALSPRQLWEQAIRRC